MNDFKTEEEFLKQYNPNKYDKLSITADIIIFSISNEEKDNYRKLNKKNFSILLVKRDSFPFKDKWCLPGGFLRNDEDLDCAAKRILKKETNLENIYLDQLYTFSNPNRDPRMRIVSTSYMSLIDRNILTNKLNYNAKWFNVTVDEEDDKVNIILENKEDIINFTLKKEYGEKDKSHITYKVIENDKLAFDHAIAIATGIKRLKNKVKNTNIAFNLVSEYFTLSELQQVYEIILNKKLLDPAFRRMIANKVIKTDKIRKDGGHRPSVLYKFNNE